MTNEQTYRGGVFSPDLPGGKAGADLRLDAAALTAVLADGSTFSWPYSESQVELGGSSGKMVFCRREGSSASAYCEQKGFLEALEEAAGGLLTRQIEDATDATRARHQKSLRNGLLLLAGLAVLFFALMYGVQLAARSAVDSLPISVDQQIGELAAPMIASQGEAVDDPALVEPIRAIVARLEPHVALAGFEYNVHVVASDVVNAFAFPGGNIVVFTGLIERAESPEQVAGVLAHEIAHVTLRHGLRRMTRAAGSFFALRLLLGDVDGMLAMGADAVNQATLLGHSRAQESEADAEGVRMLHAAGLDPEGLSEFFHLLELEYGESPQVTSWFSTHPEHDARVAAIQAQLQTFPFTEYRSLDKSWDHDWSAARERARDLLGESAEER